MNKWLLLSLAALFVISVGAYWYPLEKQELITSPAGTTFSSAKVAAINISPQSITSTSSSIYNADASDRIVTDSFVTCSGLGNMFGSDTAGVAAFQWYIGTSSVAAPTASLAARTFLAGNFTVATSSTDGFTASSTYTGTVVFGRRWNAGSYMVFQTNATSSTAVCQAGVHYLAL
jgi:hypothetical protein